ncbi:MAG: 4a-hydroxytetrahydrobiopterin dehydratase [Moraxella sp.]|uniref:4a-hydroxytetrahydrobiopterin dehydratase n=1 Tax=Moraxella sp. TaxID=479 RepID=UPI0026DD5203|nr:4a-hydroxytetrahydrobiopterin dehydratase [Moraxella sp.]MDO4449567.1 4a-hydroxytetrahydrobiopterin dehydratase [Moraxella sp.]
MSTLTSDQVALQLENFLPDWQLDGNRLVKTFEFGDFASAVAFITRLAFYCQELEHYPRLTQYYTAVSVTIGEVDDPEIYGRDVQLAKRIQACFTQ